MASGSVKLSDIARAAGVSLGTVSNVFSRPERVRPELRERVNAVAAAMGFSGPDPAGRLLMGGRANAIAMVPGGDMSVSFAIASPYLSALLLGIAETCDAHGASLTVVSGARDSKAWAIRNALVDGFILGHADEIAMVRARQRPVPFVLVDSSVGDQVNSVVVDGRAGARQAAEHLLALGHRRFAILAVQRAPSPAVWHPPSTTRRELRGSYPLDVAKLAGYAEALEAGGIAIDSVPMLEVYPPMAEEGAQRLLDLAPEATAILAMADRTAIAVLVEAARRGIDVPGRLSVIGFDDVPNAALATPPLTTMRQDTLLKGRLAAELLFDQDAPRQHVLGVELVRRGSTAAPPRN